MVLTVEQILGAGAFDHSVAIGGFAVLDAPQGPVLYAASGTGGGLSAFQIGPNGTLSLLWEVVHPLFLQPGIRPDLALAQTASGPVLYLAGADPLNGAAVRLGSDGSFGAVVALDTLPARLVAPTGGDRTDLIFAARSTGGIDTFQTEADGDLTLVAHLPAVGDPALLGLAALRATGNTVIAISEPGNTITRFHVAIDGSLTETARLGAADGLGLNAPGRAEIANVAGQNYAVIGSAGSGALSVVALESGGGLSLTDHVLDSLPTRFDGVGALAVAEVDGFAFVLAGGSDDGLSLFTLLPGGVLVHLDSIADTVPLTLTNISALTMVPVAGRLEIMAAGTGEPGLSRLSLDLADLGDVLVATAGGGALAGTAQDDMIAGSAADDLLSGGAGDDILWDGSGSDTLAGEAGVDLFVLAADGVADVITGFQPGVDRLDLSGWPRLYDASDLTVTPTATGAMIIFGDEVLELVTLSGAPISAGDVVGWDILPLDRPPFFPADREIIGGAGSEVLNGGLGNDTILAGAGEDTLSGGAGNDVLLGEAGFDTIHGDAGDDLIDGGAQADLLWGGAGDDTIEGGDGVDTGYGEEGADLMTGGSGNDRLRGGDGDDVIYGGAQEDRLYGDAGNDLIFGDAGFDLLEGGDGNDTLNGGGQADNLFGGTGDDLLIGEGGFDRLFGGFGNDDLRGGDNDDALFGEGDDDVLDAGDGNDRLNGGPGNDAVQGGAGNDEIAGGAGFDTLWGGLGDDILSGNFNADMFIFADGFGQDTITDFEATNDFEKIDLAAVSAITDWADLSANHMVQVGADVRIDGAAGDVLTLAGVSLADLGAEDFLF